MKLRDLLIQEEIQEEIQEGILDAAKQALGIKPKQTQKQTLTNMINGLKAIRSLSWTQEDNAPMVYVSKNKSKINQKGDIKQGFTPPYKEQQLGKFFVTHKEALTSIGVPVPKLQVKNKFTIPLNTMSNMELSKIITHLESSLRKESETTIPLG
jgi:hypothetical protein